MTAQAEIVRFPGAVSNVEFRNLSHVWGRAKSFDRKADAEKWARSPESELDRCGMLPDTRVAESTTSRSGSCP